MKKVNYEQSGLKADYNFGAIVLGGHAQGLGIIRSLGRKGIKVFLVDETTSNIGRFSKYCKRFFCVPGMKNEHILMKFLMRLSICTKTKGWVIFPTHDATVEILSKNSEKLKKFFRISVPEWKVTNFAINKILTYHLAKKIGIPVAHTYFPRNIDELNKIGSEVEYPIIIKPAVMHRFYAVMKKKVLKANNFKELVKLYTKACTVIKPEEVMIQEIIPGTSKELYSCGCFFKQGHLIASCIGQRIRQIPMDFGKATTFAQSVDIPQLRRYSEKLLFEIGYYGLAEVEFKRDERDGLFKLLEINPRSWKWHTLAIKAGADLPYIIYEDLIGKGWSRNIECNLNEKWIELISDVYVAFKEIIRGHISLGEYINSIKGNIEFAISSREDPLPFICYILLIPIFLFSR